VPASVRVAFLGNDRWSVPSLEALARSGHTVGAVITAAPKPTGRGNRLTPTPVATAARALDLSLFEVETVKAGPGLGALEAARPQVLAVVAYGELLPPSILRLPALAPVNLHFSLLPALRGASPVQTALLAGLERTGVTTMLMDEGLDTGPVILQREVTIEPEDDAGSLGARLAAVGGEALVETIDRFAAGPVASTPQDEALATYATRLGPRDRVLDWTGTASDLVNRCRALSPEPAATTTFRGRGLKVYRGAATEATGEPGRIVEVRPEGIVVATGRGGFRPLDLAPEGRKRMTAADLVNGLRPEVGERLG
jgi:methionyl-tRNA formyltransferase